MKTNILNAADKHIPKENGRKLKEHWMTPEIRKLFKERRLAKGDPDRYREIQNTIQIKCKRAKETWYESKCQELENLQNRNGNKMSKQIQ